ncbi:hypothetical protein F5Y18DRAFT_36616 [Xylariaceae sp. FL1019]|nr:hypothetical protein F5Y18DRAFT_36616 [Xylariaceae sp. FL1019]
MAKFEFVNVDHPNALKKHSTKIRQHVMKDIGKSRRRPKKQKSTPIAELVPTEPGSSSTNSENSYDLAIMADPLADNNLHKLIFPIAMDEERRNLARFLLSEAQATYRPFRVPWLTMGMSDSAAFYITLANAELFKGMKPGEMKPDYTTSEKAMKWYTKSLKMVSQRLIDPENHDEGLLVAIAGHICHDTSICNFERQAIHLQGLKRLVEGRGGIQTIGYPLLRLMISWHDLTGASYRNAVPYFDVPKDAITDVDTGIDTVYLQRLLDNWDRKCPYLGDLLSALKATAAVASYINRRCHEPNFWQGDVVAAQLLAPALHELLSLEGRALPDDPCDSHFSGIAAREAFRRSSLIFLASVKTKFGAVSWDLKRHIEDFRQISRIPRVEWPVVPEINLWAHTIVALQDSNDESRNQQVAIIVSIIEALGLTSAHQALEVVRGIIWIEDVFADRVQFLQDDIDKYLSTSISERLSATSYSPQFVARSDRFDGVFVPASDYDII